MFVHVFISLTAYLHSRGVTEGLPLRWQTVWSSKIFFPWLDASQPPSFSPPLYSLLPPSLSLFLYLVTMLSAQGTVALLSAWAVCRCSVSGWTRPIGLSPWCRDEMWKLRQICRGGNKAWHLTDLTPLSLWYQSRQSIGSNISNTQKHQHKVHQRLSIYQAIWN